MKTRVHDADRNITDADTAYNAREALRANIALLVIHIALLALFCFLQVWIMAIVDLCSVFAYLLFFRVARKSIHRFMPCVNIQVITHMVLAILCLGWSYGFQLTCFSLATTAFFGTYLSRRINNDDSHALLFVTGAAVLFVVMRLVTLEVDPWYVVPYSGIDTGFFCANAAIAFAIIIYYMNIFGRVVAESENRLERDAEIDRLTSLANHGHMTELAEHAFAEADAYGAKAAVALMDVDDFKQTNDRFGHAAGDFVLSAVARSIGLLQGADVNVGRWGGEEFIVVAVGTDAYPKLRARLQGIVSRMSGREFDYEGQKIGVTITCGVTERRPGEPFSETFKRADSLMYIGKARGKDCLVGDENIRRFSEEVDAAR